MAVVLVLVVLSIIFISIGFILTENNPKYYLTGYWNLSEQDREKVDLKNFLIFFKRFHIILGLSIFTIGLILFFFVSKKSAGVFITVFPIIGYLYFYFGQRKFWKGLDKTKDMR
jgi:hypothetical protein